MLVRPHSFLNGSFFPERPCAYHLYSSHHRHECTSLASRADTCVLRMFLDARFPLFTDNLEISFHFVSDSTSGGKLYTYHNNEQLLRNLPFGEFCIPSAVLVRPSLASLSPYFTPCSSLIPPLVRRLRHGECLIPINASSFPFTHVYCSSFIFPVVDSLLFVLFDSRDVTLLLLLWLLSQRYFVH